MNRRKRILAALIAAVAIGAGLYFYPGRPGNGQVTALRLYGNIEVTDVPLAFKIAGRLEARLAGEGDKVRRGQTIARLESADQQRLVDQAEAQLDYAAAQLAELEAGSRAEDIAQAAARLDQARAELAALENGSRPQEIAAARAELERAEAAAGAARAALAQAKSDEARYRALHREGGVSARQYELFRTALETARGAATEAGARVAAARQQFDLRREGARREAIQAARAAVAQADAFHARVRTGPRPQTVAAARARVAAARESLELARQRLADTRLDAPMDGVVLSQAAEAGAVLSPGMPVLVLGDLDRPWLRAYVSEPDLGRIRLGQKAAVTVDAFPDRPFEGRLTYVSDEAEFTPKTVQTPEERVKLVYRVKIQIPNPEHRLKPGMPAEARIRLGE